MTDLPIPLRVLIVEDSLDDVELMIEELRRRGYNETSRRVDSADAMRTALEESEWDVIISDYAMPGFGGLMALKIAEEKGSDVPFIVVSGTLGEDAAVAMMRAGANDYLMKDRLARLGIAIENALKGVKERRERKRAEERNKIQMEELLRWQDVMLGRADRERELKREVNVLCRRCGEAERYSSRETGLETDVATPSTPGNG